RSTTAPSLAASRSPGGLLTPSLTGRRSASTGAGDVTLPLEGNVQLGVGLRNPSCSSSMGPPLVMSPNQSLQRTGNATNRSPSVAASPRVSRPLSRVVRSGDKPASGNPGGPIQRTAQGTTPQRFAPPSAPCAQRTRIRWLHRVPAILVYL